MGTLRNIYTPLEETVGISIVPMLEISRDEIFMREKAPAGCSLPTPSMQTHEMSKNHKKVLGHMLNISRNVAFTGEKAPAECSELAKRL